MVESLVLRIKIFNQPSLLLNKAVLSDHLAKQVRTDAQKATIYESHEFALRLNKAALRNQIAKKNDADTQRSISCRSTGHEHTSGTHQQECSHSDGLVLAAACLHV